GIESMRRLMSVAGAIAMIVGCGWLSVSGCGEDCLVEQENCTAAYVEAEYGDGRGCCGGLRCSPGAISGVPICQ
ncbi:MAG: hypothetical protein AAFN74_13540, partial [Myxococcota bacterium]